MKINLTDDFAYRRDPSKKIRIICIDAPGDLAIISATETGNLFRHNDDGKVHSKDHGFDIIQMEKKPHPDFPFIVRYLYGLEVLVIGIGEQDHLFCGYVTHVPEDGSYSDKAGQFYKDWKNDRMKILSGTLNKLKGL
ncbi:MAG TPA: hypothetical protein VMW50_14580 [Dehalococcoidia bacterium]|nr:hypothetical protein [Dehalococcoidia bacterium]